MAHKIGRSQKTLRDIEDAIEILIKQFIHMSCILSLLDGLMDFRKLFFLTEMTLDYGLLKSDQYKRILKICAALEKYDINTVIPVFNISEEITYF